MKPITLHLERNPAYKHDCSCCKHLGTIVSRGGLVDLYFCNQSGPILTVIARYGDDGWDYSSGLVERENNFYVGNAELFVAATLARQQGLID